MSENSIELPPEHIAGPGIYQVVLYDPATRTRFTLQIVSYHDFPAPVQRRMGFLRDIMIEPMSEAEVASLLGVEPEHLSVKGDGAAGAQLTPSEAEGVREQATKDREEGLVEAEAAERLAVIRKEIVKALKDKEDG